MTSRKIVELRLRIEEFRQQGQVSSKELRTLAEAIGRKLDGKGGHPMYVMKGRPRLPIPHHSAPIKRQTKEAILAILDGDLAALEMAETQAITKQNGHSKRRK
jgi:hypothetical protein